MSNAAPFCDHVRPELSAFIDGELAPAEIARIEQHLRECDACRNETAALRSLAAELAALPRMSVPHSLAGTVRANGPRERTEPGERLAVRDINRKARRYLVLSQVLASAALIVLCATVAWRVMDSWDKTSVGTLARGPALGEPPVERRSAVETDDQTAVGGVLRETLRRAGASEEETDGELAAAPPPPAHEGRDAPSAEPLPGTSLGIALEPIDPTVNVVVTAQTMEQFQNALSIVQNSAPGAEMNIEQSVTGQLFADDETMAAGPLEAGLAGMLPAIAKQTPQPTEFELQVDPEQVWPLINSLELNAPRQLAIEMNFRGDDALRLQNAQASADDLHFAANAANELQAKADKQEGDQRVETARPAEARPNKSVVDRAAPRDSEEEKAEDAGGARGARRTRAGRAIEDAPARRESDDARKLAAAGAGETSGHTEAELGRQRAAGATSREGPTQEGRGRAKDDLAAGEATAGGRSGYKFAPPATTIPHEPTHKQVTFRVRVVPPPQAPATQPQTTQPSQ
jgi:hypothetical protein